MRKSSRERRAQEAINWCEKVNALYAGSIKQSIDGTKVYDGECSVEETGVTQKIVVRADDTATAVMETTNDDEKVIVLNFASFKHPGGGFRSGSMAQEESLCHHSTLYPVINSFKSFYEDNLAQVNRGLYADRALYSPDIVFIDGGDGYCREKRCGVITCAAPNKTNWLKFNSFTEEENRKALESRIEFVLRIAVAEGADTLVLGAFGCGVFKQDPKEVAEIFKEGLKRYRFKKVIFAIPRGRNGEDKNLEVFQDVFKDWKEKD